MNNIRLLIMALAAISGTGSAFTNIPKHFNGTTYYAVSDGVGGFLWQTSPPGFFTVCVQAPTYCTIVTLNNYHPANNVVPTTTQAIPVRVGVYVRLFGEPEPANKLK